MVVTVPMTAPTTAISATAETTSRVRSDQRRRGGASDGWGGRAVGPPSEG